MEALKLIQKPNLYTYHDYLSFIRAHFEYLKSGPDKLSLRAISQEAGLPPSLVAMCLSGQRRMTERVFSRLVSVLDLSKTERQVIKLLRTIAESEVAIERTDALEELQKISEYRKHNQNSTQVFRYLSNWINVAIREMLFISDFKEDLNWIKGKLRGSPTLKEIEASLEFLKSNGYAAYNDQGRLVNSEPHLDCSEGVYKLSLGSFHRQMLELAESSIEEVERDLRLILGHTFSIDQMNLPEIKSILSETLKKLDNLNKEKGSHRTDVYHLEMALFPLTQNRGSEGESYE